MGTRGEERLKAITDAATGVVAERGYYGMTIQEVSDRVGITQAWLIRQEQERAADAGAASINEISKRKAGDYIQGKLALTPQQRGASLLLMPEITVPSPRTP